MIEVSVLLLPPDTMQVRQAASLSQYLFSLRVYQFREPDIFYVTSPFIVKLEILVVTFSVDQLGKME